MALGKIGTNGIAPDAVTGALIADDAVDSEHVAAGSLDAEHYAAGSVDSDAIGADAVDSSEIAADAVKQSELNSYDSGEQTITAGGELTLAHSLGAEPFLIQMHIVCKTAEANYVAGEKVMIPIGSFSTATSNDYGVGAKFDSTNITVRFGSIANPLLLIDDANGNQVASMTPANWKLVVRAIG